MGPSTIIFGAKTIASRSDTLHLRYPVKDQHMLLMRKDGELTYAASKEMEIVSFDGKSVVVENPSGEFSVSEDLVKFEGVKGAKGHLLMAKEGPWYCGTTEIGEND